MSRHVHSLSQGKEGGRGLKVGRPCCICFVTSAKRLGSYPKSFFSVLESEVFLWAWIWYAGSMLVKLFFWTAKNKRMLPAFQNERWFHNPAANRAGRKSRDPEKIQRSVCLNKSNRFSTKQQHWSNPVPIDICWLWLSASYVNVTFCKALLSWSCDDRRCGVFAGKMQYCMIWGQSASKMKNKNTTNQPKPHTKRALFSCHPCAWCSSALGWAGPSCKFIIWGKKTHWYFLSPPLDLSSSPFLCSPRPAVSLSVALLAKSAFPGNSAWLGPVVLQPVVLGEGDLPANPYGEAACPWDRGDVGTGSGWVPSCCWKHLDLH